MGELNIKEIQRQVNNFKVLSAIKKEKGIELIVEGEFTNH